jgi:hypothetical protein
MDAGAGTSAAGSVAAPIAVMAAVVPAWYDMEVDRISRGVHAVRHLQAMVFGGSGQ